jgi:hypothetical protein
VIVIGERVERRLRVLQDGDAAIALAGVPVAIPTAAAGMHARPDADPGYCSRQLRGGIGPALADANV